jgi:hypothetical protein
MTGSFAIHSRLVDKDKMMRQVTRLSDSDDILCFGVLGRLESHPCKLLGFLSVLNANIVQ